MTYVLLLTAGFLLSMHCVGMCGGFVAALSVAGAGPGGVSARHRLAPHLVFHCGRIVMYTALGAVAGAVGELPALAAGLSRWRAVLMLFAGAMLVLSGLVLAGALRHWRMFAASPYVPAGALGRAFAATRRHSLLSAFPFGLLIGFLPCGLIYTMLLKAAAAGGPAPGALTMFCFTLGTIPALLTLGFFSSAFSSAVRQGLVRAGGVAVLLMGFLTFYQGIQIL